jgi:glutamine phosphoribosylpyrophosphate amidotransferase
MCGIVGIVARSPVNQQLYDALTVLQHRGQDAAGIMTADGGELFATMCAIPLPAATAIRKSSRST